MNIGNQTQLKLSMHPNMYIAIWVRHDFINMDFIDFMHKYIAMIDSEETSDRRRNDLKGVIYPLYREITGNNYDVNYLSALGLKKAI